MNDNKALEALDKAKNYKALTGFPIDDDIIEAFESALVELAEIKKRAKEVIAEMSHERNVGFMGSYMERRTNYILKGEPK